MSFLTLHTADLMDALCDAVDAARIVTANETMDEGLRSRWLNAIDAAWDHLLLSEVIEYSPESGALRYHSESGQVYEANGTCQCVAYAKGDPCKHRTASRIVKRALRLMDATVKA